MTQVAFGGLMAVALVAGCGSNEVAGTPFLELGSGARSFEPLSDGDDIFIVQGPQDGYHVFGSIRVRDVEEGDPGDLGSSRNPTTRFEVYVDGSRVDAMASNYTQGLRDGEDDFHVMIGRNVILDIEDDSELAERAVRFFVEFRDVNGVVLSDERELIAIPHPNNQ